jgi:hypothetical protein
MCSSSEARVVLVVLGGCASATESWTSPLPAEDSGSVVAVDADGDGYAVDADCDDADPAVYPGAVEVCNGRDDDCNGLVDDADPGVADRATWYLDEDGDGYAGTAVRACLQPADAVATAEDCDDADPSIHPAAVETCDGIDQDCDGIADDACVDPRPGEIDLGEVDGAIVGTEVGTLTGTGVQLGYAEGDGRPLYTTTLGDRAPRSCIRNRGYVYDTAPEGPRAVDDAVIATFTMDAPYCAGIVDLSDGDGDGWVDAYAADMQGSTGFVFRGPLSGDLDPADADVTLAAGGQADPAAWLGDIDGVPGQELGVGQPSYYSDWGYEYPDGRAFVFPGSVDGVLDEDDAIAEIEGFGLEAFGDWIGGVGDLDGDGIDDLCVEGNRFFLGPVAGVMSETDADTSLVQEDKGDAYQWTAMAVAAPDLDGDGTTDAVVGAQWDDQGGAAVITRNDFAVEYVTELPTRLQRARGKYFGVGAGVEVGDFDGDGATDIVVGGSGPLDNDHEEAPCTWIEYGPFGGVREIGGGATFVAPAATLYAGSRGDLAAADMDADGFDDLFIATLPDDLDTDPGTLYFWRGGPR